MKNLPKKVMVIRANVYLDFDFGSIKWSGRDLKQVFNFKYLGHVISNDTSNNGDIMRHCHYLYTVGNSLIRRFSFCDIRTNLKLFTMYCGNVYSWKCNVQLYSCNVYTGHLRWNYSKNTLKSQDCMQQYS